MVDEELAIRRSGQTPSKEFMDEKKRRIREMQEKKRADFAAKKSSPHNSNELYQVQDKYLESIAEINKMNVEMGIP